VNRKGDGILPGNSGDFAEQGELLHGGRELVEEFVLQRLSSDLDVLAGRGDGLVSSGRNSKSLLLALTGGVEGDNVDRLLIAKGASRGESANQIRLEGGLNGGGMAASSAHTKSAHRRQVGHLTGG